MSSKRMNQNFHGEILGRCQDLANPGYPDFSPDCRKCFLRQLIHREWLFKFINCHIHITFDLFAIQWRKS